MPGASPRGTGQPGSPALAWEIATHLAGFVTAEAIAEHSRSIFGVPPAQGRTYFSASMGGKRSRSLVNTVAVLVC
jgi:hypothetical protein